MNWDDFNTRHAAPDEAFEAFASHLFDRWCRRTYGHRLEQVYFLDGRGGDGGVEAFCLLRDATDIGLQAKWFRGRFDDRRQAQVRESIEQAKRRHPRLVRYVVCAPMDLSDSKNQKAGQKSGLDRWRELVEWAKVQHPGLELEFWGDRRLEQAVVELGGDDLAAYWFGRTTLTLPHLADLWRRTREAWFGGRYVPDLHCVGTIDANIAHHLRDPATRRTDRAAAQRQRARLARALGEVRRLPRLPGFEPANKDAPEVLALAQRMAAVLAAAVGRADELDHYLRAALPHPAWSRGDADALREVDDIYSLSEVLERMDKGRSGHGPAHGCYVALKSVVDALGTLRELLRSQLRINRPLAVSGRPGIGKTHAAVAAAERVLASGGVALVIPCRKVNAADELSAILSNAVDRPGSSAAAVLDAMEAATHFVNPRTHTPKDGGESEDVAPAPAAALLVIDGLEESANAHRWSSRLAELRHLLATRPRIKLVVTTRDSTAERCLPAEGFDRLSLYEATDLPLEQVFRVYAKHYRLRVDAVPWLPWALRTPLAIRLFAELHEGQTLRAGGLLRTSLPALLSKKIAALETELRQSPDHGWPEADAVLLPALRALAQRFVQAERAVTHDQAVHVLREALSDPTFASRERIAHLLDGCVAHGVLDVWRCPPDDPLAGEVRMYEPAFNAITDYLLADDVVIGVRRAKEAGQSPVLPPVLYGRGDTAAMAVAMLAASGHFIVQEGTWKNQIAAEQAERLQLRAIVDLPASQARPLREWVRGILVTSMPRNRMVLEELVVPASRIPGHPFGAEFVDEILRPMSVADRDLFWSGPERVPPNHGAPWEGWSRWDPDDLQLVRGDRSTGLPLLLAWLSSSVVQRRRTHIRHELAQWGAANPTELATLLGRMATVNDGQILEDVAVAAAGAAMRCRRDDPGLLALARQADALFFASDAAAPTDNAVTRHAARVMVERARVIGQSVSDEMLRRARPPYPVRVDKMLPIDVDTLSGGEDSRHILFGDLGWYVVKRASEGFFDELEEEETKQEGEDDGPMADLPEAVLDAIVAGKLAPDDAVVRHTATAELDRRRERRAIWARIRTEGFSELAKFLPFAVPSDDTHTDVPSGGAESQDEAEPRSPDFEQDPTAATGDLRDLVLGRRKRSMSAEADALLRRYRSAVHVADLSPEALRNALVVAHAKGLGWDRARFVGEPNGGTPGEKLGADIAILREYRHGTHGDRSQVAMFCEKYVWDAVNTVAGYLADRLPRVGPFAMNRQIEWVQDYGELGGRMPEPFQGEEPDAADVAVDEQPEHEHLWFPADLLPPVPATGSTQLEQAQEWLRSAPLPDFSRWTTMGDAAGGRLLLHARLFTAEPGSTVKVGAWVSAFAVARDDADLLRRDAQAGLCDGLLRHFDGFHCSLGGGTYVSPSVAAWAPWLRPMEGVTSHATLDDNGAVRRVEMHALTARIHWESSGEEHEAFLPAPMLRDAWPVVDGIGDPHTRCFLDRSGGEVASYRRVRDPDDFNYLYEILHARADAVRDALRRRGLVIGWFVRLYRDIPHTLYGEGAAPADRHTDHRFLIVGGTGGNAVGPIGD